MEAAPQEAQQRKFFLGCSHFSIYEAMGKALVARGGWTCLRDPAKMCACDVILGDRFAIPYHLFREHRRPHKLLVNYFKGSHRITLKASMAKVLRDTPQSEQFLPKTFILGGKGDERAHLEEEMSAARGASVWIVKPSAGCKGHGIIVTRNFDEIVAAVDAAKLSHTATGGVESRSPLFVVQRYIDRPLLFHGRKFDIRVWALLSAPYKIHVFSEASCRTASEPFQVERLGDPLVHLTNHCLQEKGAHYGLYEAGNELWLPALDSYMKQMGCARTVDSWVRPQFAHVVTSSLLAVRDCLEVYESDPFECFQLFGFDFMLDEDLRLHLIEINGSPGSADQWLEPLVDGILEIAVLPAFGCKTAVGKSAGTPRWELVWAPGMDVPRCPS